MCAERFHVGWFCSYTPIELLEAAGVQPVGLRSDTGKSHEEVFLGDSICSYVRSCFGGALAGDFDHLDGVVIAHSCECMRRLYDGWVLKQEELRPGCIHFLDVPRVATDKSVSYFAESLRNLRKSLEKRYGEIKENALLEVVEKANNTRRLVRQIYDLRKKLKIPITGLEISRLTERILAAPREETNMEIEKLIAEKSTKEGESNRPRVLVYGGPGTDRVIEQIERAGAVVVCEHYCTGIRMFTGEINVNGDPILAISQFYLDKTPCPRMIGRHPVESMDGVKKLVEEFQIDGIIYYAMKFCANLQLGWTFFLTKLEGLVPVKMLEGDISGNVNERELLTFIKKLRRGEN